MKNIHKILLLVGGLFSIPFMGCEEEIPRIEDLVAPTNLSVQADVAQDGSGRVNFTAQADNAITYHYYFGLSDNENPTVVPSGDMMFAYRASGTYEVRVVAYGSGGVSTNDAIEIEVEVTFEPPASMVQTLTNGSSRRWVWKKDVPAHLGVGPEFFDDGSIGDAPIWYQAAAFEKESEGCLYDDVLTFSLNGDGSVAYQLENNGDTYFHVDEAADALGVPRPEFDACYDFTIGGTSSVGFFESDAGIPNSTGVGFELGNSGFMSYFLNSSTYEILSISEEELHVRVVQDVDGFRLAWYQKFIAEDALETDPELTYELVWADEFEVDGAPDANNWTLRTGTGENGWGNGEAQFYTDRLDNARVEEGMLKITAKRENFSGSNFTSARLASEDKFEFTYGKVEIRAKLPKGGGTWPALWLLGADFRTNIWPAAGEIDIMEHVGNNEGVVQAALHSPSSFGDTQNKATTPLPTATDEFHIYGMIWTEEYIEFYVDDQEPFYRYSPNVRNADTYPFNKDFFLILNVAMGGTLGGAIDGAFIESTMEVDYVRVYQAE